MTPVGHKCVYYYYSCIVLMLWCGSVAAASRTATQENFLRHLTTTPAARMSEDGTKQYDSKELKQRLSEMEYAVTQLKDTEPWVLIMVACLMLHSSWPWN